MAILVTCPSCQSRFRARDKNRGKDAHCPRCGKDLVLDGTPIPDNDVFISYSNRDAHAANAVCAYLEERRLRCWMAPRDILAGADWAGAIIDAIGNSRVMVLIYSANSNASAQVLREVERAVSKGLAMVPLRIEDVPLSKNMEYFISASHWLDALHGPTHEHLERLAKTLTTLIVQHQELEAGPANMPVETAAPKRRRLVFGALAMAVALVIVGIALSMSSGRKVGSRAAATTRALPGEPIVNSVKMRLAYMPAGSFMMGALDGDPNADRDERPRHPVTISKPFYMAASELTIGQYEALMHARPPIPAEVVKQARKGNAKAASIVSNPQPDLPVVWLEFDQAQDVCEALSKLPAELAAHRKYRLPTEAEWEYACRAGTDHIFIDGDTLTLAQANFLPAGQKREYVRIQPVCSYPPNPWGLYDMLGNVREWCSDWKGEYPSEAQTDPLGPRIGKHHVVRGGAAANNAAECRPSARVHFDEGSDAKVRAGLRIVCVVKE